MTDNDLSNISINGDFGDCSVCLQPMLITENSDIRRSICDHTFHKVCIENWLQYNSTCPICRAILIPDFQMNENNIRLTTIAENNNDTENNEIEQLDYLPYRCICGNCRCWYHQIPSLFYLNWQLLFILLVCMLLYNEIMQWDGTVTDYIFVVSCGLILMYNIFKQIILRCNLRFENCRIHSVIILPL